MSGSIDAEELSQIIVTLYEVEGRSREDGEARAEEIFKLFDEVTFTFYRVFHNSCLKMIAFYKF